MPVDWILFKQIDKMVEDGLSNPVCQNLGLANSEKSRRIQNTLSIDYMGHARHRMAYLQVLEVPCLFL
ncbi:hypothetical protein BDR04DRAFT_1085749 [Suillus decipiens]|nr:hypothetical protein BDR04DRAFT_1085749 [Suillus decipiens]